jgi:glycosyltransferase involved in cell wall biosynthesis
MTDIPKVLVVANSLSGGGAENSALMVFSELRRQKIDIEFIALNRTDKIESISDKCITILNRNWKDGFKSTFQNLFEFFREVNRIAPKIVIVHCELPELYVALIPRRGLRVIVVEHTTNPWDGRKTFGKIVRTLLKLRRVSWVTVTVGKNRIWFGSGQPTMISNPVNAVIDELISKFDEKYFYIGRLRKEKRPKWAIRATIENNIPIGVIGDGELASELREEYSNKEDLVEFYGFVDNPWPKLKRDSLIIMPSEYEGDGLVAVEAIINGFAVVLSDNPDLRRLNLPPKNYFKTSEDLAHMIAESIKEGSGIFLPSDDIRQNFTAARKLENIVNDWMRLLRVVAKKR